MESVIISRPSFTSNTRNDDPSCRICGENLLGHLCPSVFQSCQNLIPPALKDLAGNIINAYRIPCILPELTKEKSTKCVPHVETDRPLSKNCNNLNSSLCSNKILWDECDIGEKLPRKKSADCRKIMQKDMKVEKNRLETFEDVWPLSYIDPSDLASVGFFYLQSGDKVQCAFCYGIIVDWAPGDDPFTEHSLHFPLCPFLMKRDVGNVPISGKTSVMYQDGSAYPEKLGLFKQTSASSTESSMSCPKFPKMESKERRRCTFHTWNYHVVKPDDLVEAGFFSTGTSDIVACFSCGGTLGHWDMGDDPWLEHKKHFPQCAYLKAANHSTVKSFASGYQESLSEKPVCAPQSAKSTDIDELMKSAVCVEASKIFSEKVVREALERQLNTKGQGFQNLEDLCSTILELQDEAERKTNSGVESQVPSESAAASDRHICKICYDKEMGVVFLPCGHMMACPQCATSITECPLCRKTIQDTVRAYIS